MSTLTEVIAAIEAQQAVRDFCDRWQRVVMMPWFADHHCKEKDQTKLKKKHKEDAA